MSDLHPPSGPLPSPLPPVTALLQAMQEPAFLFDAVGACVFANDAGLAFSPSAGGGTYGDIGGPFAAPSFSTAFASLVTGERVRKTLDVGEAQVRAFQIQLFRAESFVVAILVTKARPAQDTEAAWALLADAMPQLVWTALPDGTVDYYNHRRMEYAGLAHDAEWRWDELIHPDDQAATWQAWKEANSQDTDAYEMKHRLKLANGQYEWHVSRAMAVRDSARRVVRWYGTATNIQAVQEGFEREAAAREEAERAAHFAQVFLGIVGHDLRNPLSAIKTGAQILVRQADNDKVQRTGARIGSSVDRMARMIDQLLDFTRVRLGSGLKLNPAAVDLEALLRQLIEEVQGAHATRRFELETRGDLVGTWDADRLQQVASNLLANAAQHGGEAGHVTVRLEGTARDTVIMTVSNLGAISDDLLPNIFEPFRGGSTGSRGGGGLGLGLFISREIVQAHGGSLTVTSSVEAGTTFRMDLPRHRASDPAS